MQKLQFFSAKNKTAIVRVDLNVPIVQGKISSLDRIERIIPTIKYLLSLNSKIILISHFGRPQGEFSPKFSLAQLVDALSSFLPKKNKVKFGVDCVGIAAKKAVSELNEQEILLLENLRFHKEEKENNLGFAKELASFADIYVNDSFASSHRKHASIVAITKFLPSYIGCLFGEEIESLKKHLGQPLLPAIAVIGGSKISTKLDLLNRLMTKVNTIIVGGGMANTFLKAQKYNIGTSLYEKDLVKTAQKILAKADEYNCKIILPCDVVVADSLIDAKDVEVVDVKNVPNDKMILDLGPLTSLNIVRELEHYRTVMWNGPLGAFEYRPFNVATEMLARIIVKQSSENKLISVAGGGDVIASLNDSKLKKGFTYLSTAGGAFLEWLEGKDLPGIKALNDKGKKCFL